MIPHFRTAWDEVFLTIFGKYQINIIAVVMYHISKPARISSKCLVK